MVFVALPSHLVSMSRSCRRNCGSGVSQNVEGVPTIPDKAVARDYQPHMSQVCRIEEEASRTVCFFSRNSYKTGLCSASLPFAVAIPVLKLLHFTAFGNVDT